MKISNRKEIENIFSRNHPQYNQEISNVLDSFWLLSYLPFCDSNGRFLTTPALSEIPYELVKILWGFTIEEDNQCDDAIWRFYKSVKEKEWLVWIEDGRWYYQKWIWSKTLISSDGDFLLPSYLQITLNREIYALYHDETDIQKRDLKKINTHTEWFFEVKVIDWMLVIFITGDDLLQRRNDSHRTSYEWPSRGESIIPKVLSHIIFEYMPPNIQELVGNIPLPQIPKKQTTTVSRILKEDHKPLVVQKMLLKQVGMAIESD